MFIIVLELIRLIYFLEMLILETLRGRVKYCRHDFFRLVFALKWADGTYKE